MKAFIFAFALLIGACGPVTYDQGGEVPVPPKPRPTPPPGETVENIELLLFSAPWCHPCSEMHPEIERQIIAAKLTETVDVKVFVISTSNANQPPTEESVAAYKLKLGLYFDFVIDPWRATTLKKYFGGNPSIPAAVVLDHDDALIQKFPGGTFTAKKIVDYLKEHH